jgi:hypothetical protein
MSSNINQSPQYSDTPFGLKLQQTFSTPGTFPVVLPPNILRIYAVVIGGGGGGGCLLAGTGQGGGGGGAGGYSQGWTYVSPTVTVGSGGAAGVPSTSHGVN